MRFCLMYSLPCWSRAVIGTAACLVPHGDVFPQGISTQAVLLPSHSQWSLSYLTHGHPCDLERTFHLTVVLKERKKCC